MASMFIRCVLLFLWLCSEAIAAGHGGHNTTFDPNSYGGNWTTINCTGVLATDDASFASWKTAAVAANPSITPLRITGKCVVTPGAIFDGINNVVLWAYGSTITNIALGPSGSLTTNYFINNASIGDTSVVLQTAADASNFSVGNYMIVTGLENQYPDCGSPPNTAFFDYVLITAITGTSTKTISFSPPLTNNYKTTWPLVCGDGPASAYPLSSNWQTNIRIFGLTMTATTLIVVRGKTVSCTDCVLAVDGVNGNIAPTLADSIFFAYSFIGSQEVDKLINSLSFYRTNGNPYNWLIQSGTIKQLSVDSSSVKTLSGTPLNSVIRNSIIPSIAIGPLYGAAQSVLFDGVTVSSGLAGLAQVNVSATSYSNGTISMPLTDPNIGAFVHTGVPGFKYVLGDDHCPNCGSPQVVFTITNVRIDASNYYWDTDLMSVPTATCSGVPCPKYEGFGAQSIAQKFTPGVNFTQWAPP